MNLATWRNSTRPILDALPVRFPNGAQLDAFTGQCAKCDVDILTDNLRGYIRYPADPLIEIDAMGYCPQCHLLTPFRYDVWDDLTLLGRKGDAIAVWSHT